MDGPIMSLSEKVAAVTSNSNHVQELLERDVELLDFARRAEANGQEALIALTKTGALVYPRPDRLAAFGAGGWWFTQVVRENGKLFALPIAKFTPDVYFEAKPIERLWVEKTFAREQQKFQTDVSGDVIEWTPIAREITIHPSGRVALGEFAQYFSGRAFANVGKAKGEASPLLGIAPTQSPNAYKVEADELVVPRLDKLLKVTKPTAFAAEWNEDRKMLLVYLDGVSLLAKA